jgi:uncharacterized repeat protein (TIGR01451 family)
VFTVSISAPQPYTVEVGFATTNGTAVAPGDYGSASNKVVFPPGVVTQTIQVPVNADAAVEANETLLVNLSVGPGYPVVFGRSQGVGTIVDNTPGPQTPVIVISKTLTAGTNLFAPGDAINFFISFTNLGPGSVTGGMVFDHVPAGVAVHAVAYSGGVTPISMTNPLIFSLPTLNPGDRGSIALGGFARAIGTWTNAAIMTASNAVASTSGVPFIVQAPSNPNFPTNPTPGGLRPCICGPLTGNYVSNQIQTWFVQADGGLLALQLNTQTVNTNDPQITVADVYDGATLLTNVTVSYTAAEALAHGIGWETNRTVVLGPFAPGHKLRVQVTNGGTPMTQTHYWLKFCGARRRRT